MKISYRTHPILKKIESKTLGLLAVPTQDEYRYNQNKNMFEGLWSNTCKWFSSNVKYLTEPFGEALIATMPKIFESGLWKDMLRGSGELEGTIIYGGATICYYIERLGDDKVIMNIWEFVTHENGEAILSKWFFRDETKSQLMAYCSSIECKNPEDKQDVDRACRYTTKLLLSILAFIEYAEVETKDLSPKSKTEDIRCKYVNATDCRIKVYDSTWYTDIFKKDGFNVRGHLRLQPKKKDGIWTKEIIWINDFKKTGYTRKAGISKQH